MKCLWCLLLLMFATILPAADEASYSVQADENRKLQANGFPSDWKSIIAVVDDLGKTVGASDGVDVKSVKMTCDKNYVYFLFKIQGSAKQGVPFVKMAINADGKETGMGGYEYLVDIAFQSGQQVSCVVYPFSGIEGKVGEELLLLNSSLDGDLHLKGGEIEMRLPRKLFGGNSLKASMSLVEYVTVADVKDPDSKMSIQLNESAAILKTSGMPLALLLLISLGLVTAICGFAICARCGVSAGLAAVALIPYAGAVILLMALAFGQWPLHKEMEKLEH